MKVLILGADGMLGCHAFVHLRDRFDVVGLVRGAKKLPSQFSRNLLVRPYDIRNFGALAEILQELQPQVVLNCAGLVKQQTQAPASDFIAANSLFPHRLAEFCADSNARLIHISTDCVFSGKKGPYTLEDTPDATDIYGRSKLLGEVSDAHCLTLRTSFIGCELSRKTGLLEWFLSQRGQTIKGFRGALYTGLTALELAKFLSRVLSQHTDLNGVWHLASEPISKFDLLCLIRDVYGIDDINIQPDDDFICDRRLDGSLLSDICGYQPPPWRQMIEEMFASSSLMCDQFSEVQQTDVVSTP